MIVEARQAPALGKTVLVLHAGGDQITAADLVALAIFRWQALIVVTAYALIAASEETQWWRHGVETIGFGAANLHSAEKAVSSAKGRQAFERYLAVYDVSIGQQALLGHRQIELQAITMVRVDRVVAAQIGVAEPWHQQGAEAGIVAQLVFLVLPFQRKHPQPAVVQLAMPFRPNF